MRSLIGSSSDELSGESANELFGGDSWMHQPEVQNADTFPWMAVFLTGAKARVSDRFNADITSSLDLPCYIKDQYASAVGRSGISTEKARTNAACG